MSVGVEASSAQKSAVNRKCWRADWESPSLGGAAKVRLRPESLSTERKTAQVRGKSVFCRPSNHLSLLSSAAALCRTALQNVSEDVEGFIFPLVSGYGECFFIFQVASGRTEMLRFYAAATFQCGFMEPERFNSRPFSLQVASRTESCLRESVLRVQVPETIPPGYRIPKGA